MLLGAARQLASCKEYKLGLLELGLRRDPMGAVQQSRRDDNDVVAFNARQQAGCFDPRRNALGLQQLDK